MHFDMQRYSMHRNNIANWMWLRYLVDCSIVRDYTVSNSHMRTCKKVMVTDEN